MTEFERVEPNETTPIMSAVFQAQHVETIPQDIVIRPVWQRWLLLSLFCSLAFLQSAVFVAWNPIGNSAIFAFSPEWSATTLAWQINLATIANPFIQWPVWKIIQNYDLSRALRWGAAFPLCLATSLEFFPLVFSAENESYRRFSFAAYFFIGLVGVVFFSSITKFSRLWFPTNQRTTATGLACTCANMGALLPALVGPNMVTDPNFVKIEPSILRLEIQNYFMIFFLLTTICFVIFFFYFPTESKQSQILASDPTAIIPDISVLGSLKQMSSNKSVIILLLVYSLNCVAQVWGSTLLTLTLAPLKISQSTVGMMTVAAILTNAVLTTIITRIADLYYQKNLKQLLVYMLPTHALAMITFCAVVLTSSPSSSTDVLVSFLYVIAMASLNSCTPLLFELGCEMSYPVSEEIVSGSFDQLINIFSICFHTLFTYISASSGDYTVILYLLMIIPCITFTMFVFVKEKYLRNELVNQ